MIEATTKENHRVIAPRIFGELVGDIVGVFAPYRITDTESQVGQLWMIGDELYRVSRVHVPAGGEAIPANMPIAVYVRPARDWLPLRKFGKALPVAWVNTRDGRELEVYPGELVPEGWA